MVWARPFACRLLDCLLVRGLPPCRDSVCGFPAALALRVGVVPPGQRPRFRRFPDRRRSGNEQGVLADANRIVPGFDGGADHDFCLGDYPGRIRLFVETASPQVLRILRNSGVTDDLNIANEQPAAELPPEGQARPRRRARGATAGGRRAADRELPPVPAVEPSSAAAAPTKPPPVPAIEPSDAAAPVAEALPPSRPDSRNRSRRLPSRPRLEAPGSGNARSGNGQAETAAAEPPTVEAARRSRNPTRWIGTSSRCRATARSRSAKGCCGGWPSPGWDHSSAT